MIKIIKLGSVTKDTATGLMGMVTHAYMELDRRLQYAFQPRGLNPETGQPVDRVWVVPDRLDMDGVAFDAVAFPIEVLGTEVTDTASGFKGIAIGINMHISGCVHVAVQPKGTLAKTGAAVASMDFDIRRLKGKAIPVLTEDERSSDQAARPSPAHCPPPQRR
jgi:hypothetical protein